MTGLVDQAGQPVQAHADLHKGHSAVVCLVGMDGSGKTTHARALESGLRSLGVRSKYIWTGHANFLSYPFMAMCRALGLTKRHQMRTGERISEHEYYRNVAVAKLWPWVRLFDMLLAVLVIIGMSFIQEAIICDRYVEDILVEIIIDTKNPKVLHKCVGRVMGRLRRNNHISILLDVSERTAYSRKIGTHDPARKSYLTLQRLWYRTIATWLGTHIIATDRPFDVVHGELIEHLAKASSLFALLESGVGRGDRSMAGEHSQLKSTSFVRGRVPTRADFM